MISASSDFDQLIDVLVPKHGYAVMLQAFMDASLRESGVYCVAAFAFGRDRAKKADRKWRALWGDELCHMTDLNSRAKGSAFEGWSGDKAGDYLRKSVEIINSHASYGVAISCDANIIERHAPKFAADDSRRYLGAFRKPYGVCIHLAMAQLGRIASRKNHNARIAYLIEQGDEHQREAISFIDEVSRYTPIKHLYSHLSHTVVAKEDCRLLETADILAWEWAVQQDRRRKEQRLRPSLAAILGIKDGALNEKGVDAGNFCCIHLQEGNLQRYFTKIQAQILS